MTTAMLITINANEVVQRARDQVYIDRLKAAARRLDAPPRYQAYNQVVVQDEDLSQPIYCEGTAMAVTSYGIERRDGTYAIEGSRIWEIRYETNYGWVDHMAGKK